MATNIMLQLHDRTTSCDAITYRQLVGTLQYLSFMLPDFSANKLASFMHAPTQQHWSSLKRVFRYLKGTFNH